jgi:hypothetical protein
MPRAVIFFIVVILLEASEWLLVARPHGYVEGSPIDGIVIFYVLPVVLSAIAYHWLRIPAAGRMWQLAHYLGIFLIAPVIACATVVLFLYGLCNIAAFAVCDFP